MQVYAPQETLQKIRNRQRRYDSEFRLKGPLAGWGFGMKRWKLVKGVC
jgi:hypothetical protein